MFYGKNVVKVRFQTLFWFEDYAFSNKRIVFKSKQKPPFAGQLDKISIKLIFSKQKLARQ